MNIIELIQGLIQSWTIKPRKQNPIIYIPKKPRLQINIDTSKSRPWKGMIWHHTSVKDNIVLEDSDGVIAFHKSFRIDYVAVAPPVEKKNPNVEYIKYKNGEWYEKSKYDYWQNEFKKHKLNKNDKRKFDPAWMDVGYQGLIEQVKDMMVFNWGRPLNMIGAHAGYSDFNKNYLGFCAIGNYDVEIVTDEVWQFALMTTRAFMDAFSIPVNEVIGHREVYDRQQIPRQKQCPGKLWDMDKFRREL